MSRIVPRAVVATASVWLMAIAPAAAQEGVAAGPAPGIEVTHAVVATDVVGREPAGEASAFEAGVGRLYFYTVLEGDFPESSFEHVWIRDGEEVARVPVRAVGPRWRTWTSKAVPAGWTGEWQVRLVDADGHEMASADFTVGG
jgi:hypothetical protein